MGHSITVSSRRPGKVSYNHGRTWHNYNRSSRRSRRNSYNSYRNKRNRNKSRIVSSSNKSGQYTRGTTPSGQSYFYYSGNPNVKYYGTGARNRYVNQFKSLKDRTKENMRLSGMNWRKARNLAVYGNSTGSGVADVDSRYPNLSKGERGNMVAAQRQLRQKGYAPWQARNLSTKYKNVNPTTYL